MEDEEIEFVILTIREVLVYQIPPATSSQGHKADDWKTPIWRGRCHVAGKGKNLHIKMLDGNTGSLFAECVILEGDYPKYVERTIDSSRYFVLKISSGARHAFIGMGFEDRNDAFDFNCALSDFKTTWVERARVPTEEEAQAKHSQTPSKDLSLKEGQKIQLSFKGIVKKPEVPVGAGGGALGGGTVAVSLSAPPPSSGGRRKQRTAAAEPSGFAQTSDGGGSALAAQFGQLQVGGTDVGARAEHWSQGGGYGFGDAPVGFGQATQPQNSPVAQVQPQAPLQAQAQAQPQPQPPPQPSPQPPPQPQPPPPQQQRQQWQSAAAVASPSATPPVQGFPGVSPALAHLHDWPDGKRPPAPPVHDDFDIYK